MFFIIGLSNILCLKILFFITNIIVFHYIYFIIGWSAQCTRWGHVDSIAGADMHGPRYHFAIADGRRSCSNS
jgi:hypothetical protein